jgi:hypothetical protein
VVSYHQGWCYVEDNDGPWRELFNHARTAAYLSNSSTLGCGRIYNVLEDGGCEAYRWAPIADVLIDSDGLPLYDEGSEEWLIEGDGTSPVGWLRQTFVDPINDPAPWYNPSFPESGQALGFWITEWTGLDSGVTQRQMSARGNYGGGGVFSALGSTGREMGFEVILLGESEAALDYLYRWLDSTLSSVCSTCSADTIAIRRICPDIDSSDPDSVTDGVVEMRKVGLVQGMTWATPPIEREGCYIRSVNFTLGAMDPCMYGFCTDVEVTQPMNWDYCFAAANLSVDRGECRPSCSEMPEDCRLVFNYSVDNPSAVAPIIHVVAPTDAAGSIPMRIRTYRNPLGLLPDQLCGAPLVGELYLTDLPPYTEIRYDVAGRTVQYRSAGTGGFIDGFGFVQPNEPGVPRFFSMGCDDYTTIVEPADFCYDTAPDSLREYSDVTLQTQTRMNCV